MDWLGTNLPILGSRPRNRIAAIRIIISTPAPTGWGAEAVAEMMASTGPPPNRLLMASGQAGVDGQVVHVLGGAGHTASDAAESDVGAHSQAGQSQAHREAPAG